MGRAIVVMAKRPLPGLAKTRLARGIGDAAAARLAEAFLRDTLDHAAAVADATLVVAFTPTQDEAYFRALAPFAALVPQPDATLGERMDAAVCAVHAEGCRIVVVGTDAPHVGPERLRAAFAALNDADVCLGPSEDGGYYLVGLRRPTPELFVGVDWSTDRVLAQTLEHANALDLTVAILPTERDVDEADDLARLTERLRQDPRLAPRTAAAIANA